MAWRTYVWVTLAAAGVVNLTACGMSTPRAAGTPSPTASTSPTVLPPIEQGSLPPETKILVPYTRGAGTRQLRPTRAFTGSAFVEYACVGGGMMALQFGATSLTQNCDGQPYEYGDQTASFPLTTNLTITAPPTTRWYVRVTSNP